MWFVLTTMGIAGINVMVTLMAMAIMDKIERLMR